MKNSLKSSKLAPLIQGNKILLKLFSENFLLFIYE